MHTDKQRCVVLHMDHMMDTEMLHWPQDIGRCALFRNVSGQHQMAGAEAEASSGSKQSPSSHQFNAGDLCCCCRCIRTV